MTQPNTPLTEGDLAQFIGSEALYHHPGFNVRYTEGVRYVAERGGAYWLIDAIASWQSDPRIRDDQMLQGIQFWTLTVNSDRSAQLVCERDQGDVAVTQEIPFTDFPLQSLKLYYQQGVLFLPSEY